MLKKIKKTPNIKNLKKLILNPFRAFLAQKPQNEIFSKKLQLRYFLT